MNITHQISTETDTPKSRGFKPLEREGFFIICTMDLYMTVESLFKYLHTYVTLLLAKNVKPRKLFSCLSNS